MKVLSSTKYSTAFLWLILIGCASRGLGQVYTVTDLGVLPGQTGSSVAGINQSGQVTGNSGDHAFIYTNGAMTDLGFIAGSSSSSAAAINDKGQIVGSYSTAQYSNYPAYRKGFLWDNGVIADVFNSQAIISGTYAAIGVRPVSINNSGQVPLDVYYNNGFGASEIQNTLLWQGAGLPLTGIGTQGYAINNQSQVTLVNKPYYSYGAVYGPNGTTVVPQLDNGEAGYGPVPYGINDNGQVVGVALTDYNYIPGSHAFSWSSGAITDLGTLGGTNSAASAVNKSGVIVGASELVTGSSDTHAFVYIAGKMIDLNTRIVNPQIAALQSAAGINDLGQIAANGTFGGVSHAFLLTPQSPGSVYPARGGNTGKVTILILSPGFVPSAIKLSGPGGSISGGAITVPSYLPTAVQTTFDLTGVQPGLYSLALSQGANTSTTLSNVFTVVQGGAPDIRISIAGFAQLRAEVKPTYFAVVENVGTVDSGTVRVWVSFPDFLQWQPAGIQPSSSGSMNGITYIAFDVSPKLGGIVPVPFILTAPFNTNLAHRPFQINAWEEVQ